MTPKVCDVYLYVTTTRCCADVVLHNDGHGHVPTIIITPTYFTIGGLFVITGSRHLRWDEP
jgi:hypothetical protein